MKYEPYTCQLFVVYVIHNFVWPSMCHAGVDDSKLYRRYSPSNIDNLLLEWKNEYFPIKYKLLLVW